MLAFKPAPICSGMTGCGFNGVTPKTSTWGGSIHNRSTADKSSFIMAAASFTNECLLNSWTTNSQVVIAEASAPEGPYTRVDPAHAAIDPWAHNPQMIIVPEELPNGTKQDVFVIFTLGNGIPNGPEKDCTGSEFATNGVEGRTVIGKYDPASLNFTLHYAYSPTGPWMGHPTYFATPLPDGSLENWNPAPMLMPDGSVQVMVHTDSQPWGGEVLAEAASWRGPYTFITGDFMPQAKLEEDPFMWIDGRGNYHALFHKMFDPAGGSPIPTPGWCGGHAYSRNGTVWSGVQRAYNTTVLLANGTSVNFARRERPKLLLGGADGKTPLYLSNGVLPIGTDRQTFTLVVPLDV